MIIMTITPKNLIKHELIGLTVDICKNNVCLMRGKVVDETKNMIAIEAGGMSKEFPKKGNEFVFYLKDGTAVKVDGSRILARPEDRVKLKVKKW